MNKPRYLQDYLLLAEEDGEKLLMCLNDEPWDFWEAKNSEYWMATCEDEIASIEKNHTWDFVEPPHDAKPIGLKWILSLRETHMAA